jgi:hypothetical protein
MTREELLTVAAAAFFIALLRLGRHLKRTAT